VQPPGSQPDCFDNNTLHRHLLPQFAKPRLCDIQPLDVQIFLTHKAERYRDIPLHPSAEIVWPLYLAARASQLRRLGPTQNAKSTEADRRFAHHEGNRKADCGRRNALGTAPYWNWPSLQPAGSRNWPGFALRISTGLSAESAFLARAAKSASSTLDNQRKRHCPRFCATGPLVSSFGRLILAAPHSGYPEQDFRRRGEVEIRGCESGRRR